MATSAYGVAQPSGVPAPIVAPQYCAPYPVDLAIVRKVLSITDNFSVVDVNGNMLLKAKGKLFGLHDKRVILDAAENPVVTLQRKVFTMHSRWEAFRGDSTNSADLIFTTKTASLIQLKTKLNVYLATNTSQDLADFQVKGSWFERSCVIYAGESSTSIVAQMHKKHTAQSILFGKDHFMVTVYPNIDYAFIVALIVLLDAINSQDSDSGGD